MDQTYTTKVGDQWDSIAKNVYGSELLADYLMAHNFPLLDVYGFDAGTVLATPDLPVSTNETLPDWRQSV